jgi:amino acid adenylation domain-containing protein
MGTTGGEAFSRPVTMMESFLLAQPRETSMCIQIVVEGRGILDPKAVAEAVALAARSCRGARLVRQGRRWWDSGRAPQVRVLDGNAFDRETFEGLPALFKPLTCEDGEPTNEVVVLTGVRPALVFRVGHAVMDAKGVLLWMEQVFRALRGEQPRHIDGIVCELGLWRSRASHTYPKARSTVPPPLRSAGPLANYRQFFLRRTIDGNHHALVAKLFVALNHLCNLDAGFYSLTVDLRRHLPTLEATDNLSYGLAVPVTSGETWQQVHQRILRMLAENRELPDRRGVARMRLFQAIPLRVLRHMLTALDTRMATKSHPMLPFLVSHLGRRDLAACSTEDFTADSLYSIPIRGVLMPPHVTVTEVPGRTELVISGDDAPGLRTRARELLDGIEAMLCPAGSIVRGRPVPQQPDTLTAAFAAQVRRSPEAVALIGADGPVTYAELDARSAGVAAGLVAQGVRRGDVVALLSGRSAAAVAGIWGVLKAGAAYLPLAPENPDARLRSLLLDAGSSVCLVERPYADRKFLPDQCTGILLDELVASPAAAAPTVYIAPDDLAYVIYTSGSTGRPKGVEVEHRAALAYSRYAIDAYGIDETSCFPLFTSLAFDLPVTALLPPLLAGGRVALVEEKPSHRSFARAMTEYGVNSIKLTPPHLELIARLGLTAAGMRIAIVGGEVLPVRTAEAARKAFGPQCRIINEYGPTEVTVGCIAHTYDPERDTGPAVPIGRPVPNTTVYLLDEQRAWSAPGEAGEMYLAGPQLARGYRGRPDLHRKLFVTLADGTRAYRTGDLARLLPDGELDYLGRCDDQIKILGHRVEPAEISQALERHPAVRQALVAARSRPGTTTKILCAYVVTSYPVAGGELLSHVAGLLPSPFVPSVVVDVPALPQNAHGKTDLAALPDPFAAKADTAGPLAIGERDEIGEAIAKVWARELNISAEDLTSDSDFSHLGGTSIAFLSMVAGICTLLSAEEEQQFMAELSRAIKEPTLYNITALVREVTTPPRPSHRLPHTASGPDPQPT